MAFLGKLTIIIGAGNRPFSPLGLGLADELALRFALVLVVGLVGSALSKEGGLKDVTGFFSGALKIVSRHLSNGEKEGSQSGSKPHSDALLAQVNTLRQELQLLASSRSVTIVTGSSSGNGSFRVKVIIVIGVVGYGYIWWKGWKITDMMFVTRRGFSSACNSVGKQVDMVSSSLAATKRHLSSRLDRVDSNVDECKELTAATQVEVSRINGDLSGIREDFESVIWTVQNMETKLVKMEESQDFTRKGILHLCKFTENLELTQDSQSSSQRAIGPAQHTAVTRTSSAPPLALELPSPSTSSEPPKVLHTPKAVSIAGLKDLQISNTIKDRAMRTSSSTASSETSSMEEPSSSTSGSSMFGWRLPGLSVLTRTRSTAN